MSFKLPAKNIRVDMTLMDFVDDDMRNVIQQKLLCKMIVMKDIVISSELIRHSEKVKKKVGLFLKSPLIIRVFAS